MRALFLSFSSLVLAACATHAGPASPSAAPPAYVAAASASDFATTLARLQAAVTARGFKLVATVDHAASAAVAGLTLAPSTVVIFGNPAGGTPLMQANPVLGLDLPLRALVYLAEDGMVKVLIPDITALAAARGLDPSDTSVQRVSDALAAIRAEAVAAP